MEAERYNISFTSASALLEMILVAVFLCFLINYGQQYSVNFQVQTVLPFVLPSATVVPTLLRRKASAVLVCILKDLNRVCGFYAMPV